MRGKWVLLAVSAVLLGIALGALSLLRQQSRRPATARKEVAQSAQTPVEITLPAHIRARQIVPVQSEVNGTVAEMLVDAGQEVYLGQLMARITNQGMEGTRENAKNAADSAQARVTKIESTIIAARLEASRARADAQRSRTEFEQADKLYRRQKFLLSEGATPRLTYERVEKDFHTAETEYTSLDTLAKHAENRVDGLLADLQNAKKVLDDKTAELESALAGLKSGDIYAPVDGVVVTRKTEAGKTVGDGQSMDLFDIAVNPAALEAVVEAEPSALKRLHPGQTVALFFADIPNEGIPGTLREIRQNLAYIDFTSPDPLTVKHGGSAQVRLKLD